MLKEANLSWILGTQFSYWFLLGTILLKPATWQAIPKNLNQFRLELEYILTGNRTRQGALISWKKRMGSDIRNEKILIFLPEECRFHDLVQRPSTNGSKKRRKGIQRQFGQSPTDTSWQHSLPSTRLSVACVSSNLPCFFRSSSYPMTYTVPSNWAWASTLARV